MIRIIQRRDTSAETRDLIERGIELAKPGNMRHHYNKRLQRQILVPRRPDKEERKEIKRIDTRLKRKKEHRITHIGGGYFRNFGDQTPQGPQEPQEPGTSAETPKETSKDAESTISSAPEEPVITQEPGAYPAFPVQQFRDGPVEEIAVQYVRINWVVENKATGNKNKKTTSERQNWTFCSILKL